MMRRRWVGRLGQAILSVLGTVVVASAQTATLPPPVGEEGNPGSLAASPSRVGVFAGAFYGAVSGSEIENADPGTGFEGGASYRVLSDLSVWGSAAWSSFDVSGQVASLLGKRIQDSGRSATIDGSLVFTRARIGVRVDGLREPGFRFQPYLAGAVTFAKNKAKIDDVDHRGPKPTYTQSRIGGYGRFGVEFRVAPRVDVDGYTSYEVFKFPPSTDAAFSVGAGIHLRL
ncbi:MAG: outer membrane beta-barrel protein [bacterium]